MTTRSATAPAMDKTTGPRSCGRQMSGTNVRVALLGQVALLIGSSWSPSSERRWDGGAEKQIWRSH
jgi:hypothetical protein